LGLEGFKKMQDTPRMPSTLTTPVLAGVEVTLRPLAIDDVVALAEAAGESREHFGLSVVPDGVDQMRRYVERFLQQRERGERLPFATVWRGRVVGSTSFIEPEVWDWPPGRGQRRTEGVDTVEIGSTWLAASAQRTRCNTEAKALMLAHAFEQWRAHSVSFKTDERNQRSRRAIERLGARFEGIRRAHLPAADGAVRSSAYYSIVSGEWPSVKAALAERLAGVANVTQNPLGSRTTSSRMP
jgi:N-acetyltransferase